MTKIDRRPASASVPKKSKPVATRVVAQENVSISAPYVEADELRDIEIALSDAECDIELDAIYPPESNADLLLQVEDMLEELIYTASKSQSSTVSHLAFVLTTLFPRLDKVSKLAAMALCRKHGVTFEWSRTNEFDRVQSDVKERKQAAKRLK